jgi:hypothetical protein
MGFTEEADAYMEFISDRFRKSRSADGALPIMFSITGSTDLPELELKLVSLCLSVSSLTGGAAICQGIGTAHLSASVMEPHSISSLIFMAS